MVVRVIWGTASLVTRPVWQWPPQALSWTPLRLGGYPSGQAGQPQSPHAPVCLSAPCRAQGGTRRRCSRSHPAEPRQYFHIRYSEQAVGGPGTGLEAPEEPGQRGPGTRMRRRAAGATCRQKPGERGVRVGPRPPGVVGRAGCGRSGHRAQGQAGQPAGASIRRAWHVGDRYLETWHSGGLAFRELAFGVLGIKRPDIQGASIGGTGIQGGRVQGADIQRPGFGRPTFRGPAFGG